MLDSRQMMLANPRIARLPDCATRVGSLPLLLLRR
jgi:hypothetical protein